MFYRLYPYLVKVESVYLDNDITSDEIVNAEYEVMAKNRNDAIIKVVDFYSKEWAEDWVKISFEVTMIDI